MGKKKGKGKKSKGQIKREKAQKAKLEAQAAEVEKRRRQEAIERGEDPDAAIKKKEMEKLGIKPEPEVQTFADEDIGDVKEFSRDIRLDQITVAPIGGGTPLIQKANLKLIHGHRYGLIGKNGAGKTTLLRHIEEKSFPGFPTYLRVHLVQQEMEGSDMTVIETVMAADKEITSLQREKESLLKILDAPERLFKKESRKFKIANGLIKPEEIEKKKKKKKKTKTKKVAKIVEEENVQLPSNHVIIKMAPGKLGVIGNWEDATITRLCDDIHIDLKDGGAQPGWKIIEIENLPFDLQLMKKKIQGRFNYSLKFQTGPDPVTEEVMMAEDEDDTCTVTTEESASTVAAPEKQEDKTGLPKGMELPMTEERQQAIEEAEKVDPMRLIFIDERLAYLEADSQEKRASEVLDGLQFTDRMKNMPTSDLSGGWRMRVSLACGLFIEPDVLMLDEPTNHLDFPSVMWLTDYLSYYNSEKVLVLVSHDRSFMNEVTTDIIHLDRHSLIYYKGNYGQFAQTREDLRRHQATQYKKQQREIAHQEDFIRRFAANKKWSTQAQSRRKLLTKMVRVEKVFDEANWRFAFPDPPPLRNNSLLDIEECDFGYFGNDPSKDTYLLTDVNVRLGFGEKIGVIGANGAGKSTLLKLIMKELEPLEGKCFMRNEVTHGYFAQHHMETIDMDATPLQFLRHEFVNTPLQACYSKLGRFNISPKNAKKPIGTLSGGEKSRLAFSILTWYNPHLVIMDEPTNHLDIQTQDSLVNALQTFKGSLLIVSHDKHLLTEVCTEFWVVGNRTVTVFKNFDKATTFCYKKCKPVDVLPREFSTISTKDKKKIPERAKRVAAEEVLAGFVEPVAGEDAFFIDCERELQKGIRKGLPPNKILMHIKGWTPTDGDQGAMNIFIFHMFTKYFTDPEAKDLDIFDFLEDHAKLVKFLVPNDHLENQYNLVRIAQSCWYTAMLDNYPKALEEGILETIFECFFQFGYVMKASFQRWYSAGDDDTTGRAESKELLEDWFAGVLSPEPEEAVEVELEEETGV